MSNHGLELGQHGAYERTEPGGVRIRNSVNLGGFFSILARQRLWILAGLIFAFALAFYYIFFSPLTYTSTISILIDARDRQTIGSDQAPMPQQADPIMVESQLKLMTSESVLRRVIANEHLESDPEFAPSDHVGLISGLFSLFQRGTVSAPAIDQIVNALTERISVKRPDRTYVVDMEVKASNPGKAARLADAIAKAFLDEERSAADVYTQDQFDWVVQRTKELRAKVEEAEKKVQDYKATNGIVDVAGTLTQEQQLQEANRDLVAARAKAGEAQSRVDQIRKIIASGKTLDGSFDTINSTVIRQLRVQYSDLIRRQAAASQKYGSRHPEILDIEQQLQAIRGQINDEMQRISSALTNEAQVARGNEDAAQKRVQILENKTTDTNATSLQLRELQREADSERSNYEKFLRANESIRRNLTETPYARIVAPASFPSKPSSPKVLAALLIAASGGLSLGIGLAVAMDRGSQIPDYTYGGGYPAPWPGPAPSGPPGPPEVPPPARDDQRPPGRRPLVAEPNHREPPLPSSALPPLPGYPGEQFSAHPVNMQEPQSQTMAAAPDPATVPMEMSRATSTDPLTAPSTAIDPRELAASLFADLSQGRNRRFFLTAHSADRQKTELALTLAKAIAAHGHAILLIDGDNQRHGLSRMAIREGLPARIRFDQMEVSVLGIPSQGNGVVFVLPHQAATGDLAIVESPFIECQIGAVIVDGPAMGPELGKFTGLTTDGYLLDDRGYLTSIDMHTALREPAQHQDHALAPMRFAHLRTN